MSSSDHTSDVIDREQAEKDSELLEQDYATACPNCGGVVFDWWDSDICRDCEDSKQKKDTEQMTLITDGGTVEEETEQQKAERFWSRYEIPFDYDTCIKVRRSGLLRGSSGTGHAKDTVVHLHVKEPFKDGRLSRSEDSYLCENDSFVGFQGREERWSEDGEAYVPRVTCETCLQRMERWLLEAVGTAEDGDSDE